MIKINPKITEKLQEYNLPVNLGTLCLLSIYHGLDAVGDLHLSPELVVGVNLTKIVERDYQGREDNPRLIWNIPLYADEPAVDENWAWIEDWRKLFGALRPDAIGSKKDCYLKMKKYFAQNPHVRKEDIIAATKMYLLTFRGKDPAYLQKADYFISKVVKAEGGSQFSSRLDMYLEILKDSRVSEAPQAHRQMNQVL